MFWFACIKKCSEDNKYFAGLKLFPIIVTKMSGQFSEIPLYKNQSMFEEVCVQNDILHYYVQWFAQFQSCTISVAMVTSEYLFIHFY